MAEKLKITILYDSWGDEEAETPPEPKRKSKKRKRRREKHDREEIFEALEKLGHEPSYQPLDGTDKTLSVLSKTDADLFFNLTESYAGDDTKEMHVAAYLDLLGRVYTGAGPQGLYLAQDKSLAKKLFKFHAVASPYFATCYRGRLDHAEEINFPLIVKPTSEDGSIGIDQYSVVSTVKQLMERIHYIQDEFDSPALIEEYIDGREIYAAILGNERPEALPLIELDLSKLPEGMAKVAGTEVKWEKDTEAYKVTKSAPAEDLDEETTERLQEAARTAYRALKLRDYGRIDMRLTNDGTIYVIEANPNPWLSSQAEFAMAARGSERTYTEMIKTIVEVAVARYDD